MAYVCKVCRCKTFLYYSYGSNLWSFRIHMNNPSAEFVSIGRIDNYRLDFIRYSKFWGGATATIVPTANAQVWGVIWRMHKKHMENLDEQEGVALNIYYNTDIEVLTPHMGTLTCRVYIQTLNSLPRGDNDPIPVERSPSWVYKEVIIIGALEHQLPEHYIDALEKIKDNGDKGCFKMFCLLRRFATHKPCSCRLLVKRKTPVLNLKKIREWKLMQKQLSMENPN